MREPALPCRAALRAEAALRARMTSWPDLQSERRLSCTHQPRSPLPHSARARVAPPTVYAFIEISHCMPERQRLLVTSILCDYGCRYSPRMEAIASAPCTDVPPWCLRFALPTAGAAAATFTDCPGHRVHTLENLGSAAAIRDNIAFLLLYTGCWRGACHSCAEEHEGVRAVCHAGASRRRLTILGSPA